MKQQKSTSLRRAALPNKDNRDSSIYCLTCFRWEADIQFAITYMEIVIYYGSCARHGIRQVRVTEKLHLKLENFTNNRVTGIPILIPRTCLTPRTSYTPLGRWICQRGFDLYLGIEIIHLSRYTSKLDFYFYISELFFLLSI